MLLKCAWCTWLPRVRTRHFIWVQCLFPAQHNFVHLVQCILVIWVMWFSTLSWKYLVDLVHFHIFKLFSQNILNKMIPSENFNFKSYYKIEKPRSAHLLFPTAQKMKFFIKDFFSKCDQICSFLKIWLHLLKRFLMENFNFCAVSIGSFDQT